MNLTFKRKCDFILNRYPEADEKHLIKMLNKLVD